jgi:DNA-binding response OmpR family regulator
MDLKGVSSVEITHNLEDGKKILTSKKIDYVVTDLRFQSEKILPFLNWVKTLPEKPEVLAFSNLSEKTCRDLSLHYGIDRFFDKSLELEQLVKFFLTSTPQQTGHATTIKKNN